MRLVAAVGIVCCLTVCSPVPAGEVQKGVVAFKGAGDQKNVPERYRLDDHDFSYELEFKSSLLASDVDVYRLRFPSAVETPRKANNTVHGEFFRPRGDGPFPGVVVLDILAGDGQVARMFATYLAQKGIAALYVHMPYYGPRREPGTKERLLSPNVNQSLDGMRQAVLDVRRAGAWLANRPDVNAEKLGIVGVSLGSFIASLSAEMEPRFRRVAVVLGGGGLVEAYYDDPRAIPLRLIWEQMGFTKETLQRWLAPVDPLTCAGNLKDRQVLILAAKHDEVVPPRMAEAMFKATGEQEIHWFDCGHYTALLHVGPALDRVVRHFEK